MFYFNSPEIMNSIKKLGQSSNVVVVSQDNGAADWFDSESSVKHFDTGITEQNLIGIAAGIAHTGKTVFVLSMAPFVSMRAFEQIRDDCAYNRKNVKILAMFTGLEAGYWGVTHHSIEDIALMRTIPGMTVIVPADCNEVFQAIMASGSVEGPCYLRIAGFAADMSPLACNNNPFAIGKSTLLHEGNSMTLIATGTMVRTALAIHEAMAAKGIRLRVINMHTIKPIDQEIVKQAAKETGLIVTLEEHFIMGALGGAISEIVAELGVGRVVRLGIPDRFVSEVGPYEELLENCGLDTLSVTSKIQNLLNED